MPRARSRQCSITKRRSRNIVIKIRHNPCAKSGNDAIVLSRFSTYLQHPDICVNIAEIAADKESIRWLVSDFILI